MKLCSLCGLRKRRNPRCSHCKECHNERMKAYYKAHPESTDKSRARRRTEVRDFIKEAKDQPCADCKIKYPFYVMDFDHVRGEKKFNLAQAASAYTSIKLTMEEAAKCDVVCSNCHRLRTQKRREEAKNKAS